MKHQIDHALVDYSESCCCNRMALFYTDECARFNQAWCLIFSNHWSSQINSSGWFKKRKPVKIITFMEKNIFFFIRSRVNGFEYCLCNTAQLFVLSNCSLHSKLKVWSTVMVYIYEYILKLHVQSTNFLLFHVLILSSQIDNSMGPVN